MSQYQGPDMYLSISFASVSNSPPPSLALWGQVNYARQTQPIFPGMHIYTNELDLLIGLPVKAVDGWLWEREANGSFTRVAELTNQVIIGSYYPDYSEAALLQQSVTLTTNQIQSLITGNLYAEINFGESNYWGNLDPQYRSVNGPTATMHFPPARGQNTAIGYTVIAPNNRTIAFVCDGSYCTDPFYLPIQYHWTAYDFANQSVPVFTGDGVLATNSFKIGTYAINLELSDAIATNSWYYFYLVVITPGQAVDSIISDVQSAGWPNAKKKAFLNMLFDAERLFNIGAMGMGCDRLKAYMQLVKAAHFDRAETSYLLQEVQNIIDAFPPPHRGLQFGRVY